MYILSWYSITTIEYTYTFVVGLWGQLVEDFVPDYKVGVL